MGFEVDKAAGTDAGFSEYSGSPCQSLHRLLHTSHRGSVSLSWQLTLAVKVEQSDTRMKGIGQVGDP
jgi:hypothetical protein